MAGARGLGSCLPRPDDRGHLALDPEGGSAPTGAQGRHRGHPPGSDSLVSDLPSSAAGRPPPASCASARLVAHKDVAAVVRAVPGVLRSSPTSSCTWSVTAPSARALERLVADLGLEGHVVHPRSARPRRARRLMRTAWLSVYAHRGRGLGGVGHRGQHASGSRSWPTGVRASRDSIRDEETGWLIDEGQALGKAPLPRRSTC